MMRKKLRTLVAMALCAASPAAAMVGPSTPAPDLARHVVMVLARSAKGAGFCTGTVLAPDKILTAAHCVTSAANMRVHYRDAQNAPVLLDVKGVAVHPGFHASAPQTREKSIDLAVVTLAKALPDDFEPMPLSSGDTVNVSDTVTLAGFGVAQEGQSATSGILRQIELSLRAPQSEVLFWLTGADGLGACTGDSGGPVLSNGAIVGVISWTEGANGHHCGTLTQAIRLKGQMNWVEKEMGR